MNEQTNGFIDAEKDKQATKILEANGFKEPSLPLDMAHTVISEQTEKQMREQLKESRKARPRKQMHDYVEEVKQLTIRLHESECMSKRFQELLNDETVLFDTATKINEAYAEKIDKPSFRFALGLVWKAIKQGRW